MRMCTTEKEQRYPRRRCAPGERAGPFPPARSPCRFPHPGWWRHRDEAEPDNDCQWHCRDSDVESLNDSAPGYLLATNTVHQAGVLDHPGWRERPPVLVLAGERGLPLACDAPSASKKACVRSPSTNAVERAYRERA